MPFQPVSNVVNVFVEYRMPSGALVGNSYNILDEQAGVVSPRVDDLATLFQTWASTSPATASRSNEVTVVRVNARDLTTENGQVSDLVVSPPVAGAVVSPAMPAQVTLSVKLGTGLAGRSARGRLYHVGLAEAQVGGDLVTGGAPAAILLAYTTLRTTLIAADFQWVVVQRQSNGVFLSEGVARVITQISLVDQRVDTQRRRLVGNGS